MRVGLSFPARHSGLTCAKVWNTGVLVNRRTHFQPAATFHVTRLDLVKICASDPYARR
jgi:hypothetical protein